MKVEVIKLGNYKGIKAPESDINVAEEDIDAQLNMMRVQAAKPEDIDTPAANGDIVVIDYKGFVDDVAFEGGEDTNYSLELGSGTFIPGFEEQLVGTQPGDQKDVVVTFPEQYHAPNLAGKEAIFKCTVHKVQQKKLPELSDELVQSVTPCKTVEELRQWIRNEILQEKAKMALGILEDFVLEKVAKESEVKIPLEVLDERVAALKKNLEMQLMMQGANLQMYLDANNQTMEQFDELLKSNACVQLKSHAVMTEVALRENCTVTEEDLNAEIHNMATQYQMSDEDVRNRLGEEHLTTLRADLLAKKGLHIMVSNAE